MSESPLGTSARVRPGVIPEQQGLPDVDASVWDVDATLLLVEDDAGDALLVEEMLSDSELDAPLTWCKTMAEARRFLLGCRTPVCVLLDLHLPDVHGLDAVRQLVESAPDAAVIVLTGLDESQTGLSAVAQGAQDYLVKGRIDPEVLGRAVRYALQRKHAERSAAAMRAGQLIAQENARLERALLPIPLLLDNSFLVAARYEAGRAHGLLSGDFYDVVQTSDGAVHAVIGDVSGHGARRRPWGSVSGSRGARPYSPVSRSARRSGCWRRYSSPSGPIPMSSPPSRRSSSLRTGTGCSSPGPGTPDCC